MAVDFPRPVVHGGTGKQKQEKTGKTLLDFSASLNPLPPRFSWACDPECLSSYPDNEYFRLKECIAGKFHRHPDEICVGNGSIELIRVFCSVVLSKGKTYYAEIPTFGEYALSAQLAGAKAAIKMEDAAVSFVCNPNNPTGTLRNRSKMKACIDAAASCDGILFADEAFIELADPSESLAGEHDPSLFVLRSLTKSFAVPGLRFGYGFGDPDLVERIETARPPWCVNAYAEAYALEAFRHLDALEQSREYIRNERDFLYLALREIGLWCHPSTANYLLVDCPRAAQEICRDLEAHDILVRDCTSFGLPTSIRIAVRTREENAQLVEALSACLP